MLAIERRNAILSKLYLDGKVIVSELSTNLMLPKKPFAETLKS